MESSNNVVPIREAFECVICGGTSGRTQDQELQFNYGKGDAVVQLTATVPVDSCDVCGEEILGDNSEEIRHEAVCEHLGVLSPKEILSLRKNLAMTREQIAELTGIGSASFARWECGSHIQNTALDRYLRLIAKPGVLATLNDLIDEEEAEMGRPNFQCLQINSSILDSEARFRLN